MGKQYVIDIDGYKRRMINPFEPDPVHFSWIDSMVPASAAALGASAPTLAGFGASGGVKVYEFAHVTDDEIHAVVQFNHNAKQGQVELEAHVHWSPTDAAAGTVIWDLEYMMADKDGVFGAPTTIRISTQTDSVAWKHHFSEFPAIPVNMTISKIMVLRLVRMASVDTYGNGISLLGFDIHHKVDSFGSRQEYVK